MYKHKHRNAGSLMLAVFRKINGSDITVSPRACFDQSKNKWEPINNDFKYNFAEEETYKRFDLVIERLNIDEKELFMILI